MIPIYSLHRDPKYYPNPEVFDPERFIEGNKSSRPHGTFLPFGDGPRICIGRICFCFIYVTLIMGDMSSYTM